MSENYDLMVFSRTTFDRALKHRECWYNFDNRLSVKTWRYNL